MDGSTEPFVFLIQSAGLKSQSALKRFIRVKKKVQVSTSEAWVVIEPSEVFQLDCTLMTNETTGDSQQYSTTLSSSIYTKSLSRARHGTNNSLCNRRYSDECIRHHVLDTIGDLYTLGYGLLGSLTSYNTNHKLNNHLLSKLLANPQAWELTEYSSQTHSTAAESTYY
jgi:UDP-3-O-[3-hydroxymyristoyl] N-acetylglucosamine deacetylase